MLLGLRGGDEEWLGWPTSVDVEPTVVGLRVRRKLAFGQTMKRATKGDRR